MDRPGVALTRKLRASRTLIHSEPPVREQKAARPNFRLQERVQVVDHANCPPVGFSSIEIRMSERPGAPLCGCGPTVQIASLGGSTALVEHI
jgi:hypothetical protein